MRTHLKRSVGLIGIGLFMLYIFKTLTSIQEGYSLGDSLRMVLTSLNFWLFLVAPFILICFPLLLFMPAIHRLMTSGGMNKTFVWRKAALSYTIMGILVLLIVGFFLIGPLFSGQPMLQWDQFATLAVFWVGYAILITYRYFMKPDSDLVKAYEKGDPDRYNDERQQQIVGKAAVSTLYALFFIIFSVGFLFDMFVTHIWPVRSLTEIILIVIIWFVNMQKWAKKI